MGSGGHVSRGIIIYYKIKDEAREDVLLHAQKIDARKKDRRKERKKDRRGRRKLGFKGEDAHLKLWCESSFLNQMLCLFTL